jgi:hypothetical protein
MRSPSRRSINRSAHQFAVSASVVFGFLIAFALFYGIDFERHRHFLPLPFALAIVCVLVTYAVIRTVGWLVSFAFPAHRRHRSSAAAGVEPIDPSEGTPGAVRQPPAG